MADLTIKPQAGSGNKLIIQDQAGNARVTTSDAGIDIPAVTGNLTVAGDIVPSTPLSHRNMIINGAMQISQRATTTHPTPKGANDDGYYLTDRWRLQSGGTTPSRFNLIQESITDLAGFSKAMKVDCTTASASPGADDYVKIVQRIEGFNLQQMERGFSSAKPITLSFWVKGTASRTYVVELRDASSTARSAIQQFTVTASWVKHSYTFPGDTGGDKVSNDNTKGFEVGFWFHAGANFRSGTYTALTWQDIVEGKLAPGISDSGAGVMNTTSDEVLFTGVQLELGSNATPFEHRSYGEELLRCMRYFQVIAANAHWGNGFGRVRSNTSQVQNMINLHVPMRNTPDVLTFPTVGQSSGNITFLNGEAYPSTHGTINETWASTDQVACSGTGFSAGGAANETRWAYAVGTAYFKFQSEL